MTAPIHIKKFIKKFNPGSANYIFATATRAGTTSRTYITIDKILSKKGKHLDSYFYIKMPNNDPKFKDRKPPTAEEAARYESIAQTRLDNIRDIVINKRPGKEKDTEGV
jgi:hypothetical protein